MGTIWRNIGIIGIAFILYVSLPVTAQARSLNELNVYVWNFTTPDHQENELTQHLTREFEKALIHAECVHKVLDRRELDRLIANKENEKRILGMDEIPESLKNQRTTGANAVIFGEVYDDQMSGEIQVTVTIQAFDGEKLDAQDVRFVRWESAVAAKREQYMQELAVKVCSSPLSAPTPTPTPLSAQSAETTVFFPDFFDATMIPPWHDGKYYDGGFPDAVILGFSGTQHPNQNLLRSVAVMWCPAEPPSWWNTETIDEKNCPRGIRFFWGLPEKRKLHEIHPIFRHSPGQQYTPTSYDIPTQKLSFDDKQCFLRCKPAILSKDEIVEMIRNKGFNHPTDLSDRGLSPEVKGKFQPKYESKEIVRDKVVIDLATGLMWQQSGTITLMTLEEAREYIIQLNSIQKYAGYTDWRLPTIEELASLMAPTANVPFHYGYPEFDSKQKSCWSADQEKDSGYTWIISFTLGSIVIASGDPKATCYVRAVRMNKD